MWLTSVSHHAKPCQNTLYAYLYLNLYREKKQAIINTNFFDAHKMVGMIFFVCFQIYPKVHFKCSKCNLIYRASVSSTKKAVCAFIKNEDGKMDWLEKSMIYNAQCLCTIENLTWKRNIEQSVTITECIFVLCILLLLFHPFAHCAFCTFTFACFVVVVFPRVLSNKTSSTTTK